MRLNDRPQFQSLVRDDSVVLSVRLPRLNRYHFGCLIFGALLGILAHSLGSSERPEIRTVIEKGTYTLTDMYWATGLGAFLLLVVIVTVLRLIPD